MRIQNLTYQAQIFIALMLLMAFPLIILGITTANYTVRQVNDQYLKTLNTIAGQTNLNLETLLSDADKIGNLHIINEDIQRILNTDYSSQQLKFAQDSYTMRTQITQANRLNASVVSCIFQNRFGFVFDYNFTNNKDLQSTLANLESWAAIARTSEHYSYVGPIQHPLYSGTIYRNVLPMVKILRDINTNSEIGVFYVGVNFSVIANIIQSTELPNSTMLFYNQAGELSFSSDESFQNDSHNQSLLNQLQQISGQVNRDEPIRNDTIADQGKKYTVVTIYNKSTGWRIVHFLDNTIINEAYRSIIQKYGGILVLSLAMSLFLAFLLSNGLTKSISQLCAKIDALAAKPDSLNPAIDLQGTLLNRELQKVVHSYNSLNHKLADSLNQNYQIRTNEKLMQFKVLQTQINPHFLYNTLNLISSLANIHEIPEIRTIATSLSELLRFNLKSGPIVQLRMELDQIAKYIAIQQMRFPGKFRYACSVPDEYLPVEVPAFLLQPLVENAIGHGLANLETGGMVNLNAYAQQDILHVLIADNGAGIESDQLQEIRAALESSNIIQIDADAGSSIGLLNVHQRIQAYYGREYGLTIESMPQQGTIIEIVLPLHVRPRLPEIRPQPTPPEPV